MRTKLTVAMLVVLLALWVTAAAADPWPNYASHTTTVDYVTVVPVFDGGTNTWTFQLAVVPGATDPVYGLLDPTYGGVKGFAVYQPYATTPLGPDYYSDTRPGWNHNGGWIPAEAAFGWLGEGPTTYVHPGDSDTTNFWAHWTGAAPALGDFGYLVHIAINSDDPEGATFWARIGEPIPEPASLALLGAGIAGLLMMRRRRR